MQMIFKNIHKSLRFILCMLHIDVKHIKKMIDIYWFFVGFYIAFSTCWKDNYSVKGAEVPAFAVLNISQQFLKEEIK